MRDLVRLRRRQKLNKPELLLKSSKKKKSGLLLMKKPDSPPWWKRKWLKKLALLRKSVSLLSKRKLNRPGSPISKKRPLLRRALLRSKR